jgi:hypothetical protein
MPIIGTIGGEIPQPLQTTIQNTPLPVSGTVSVSAFGIREFSSTGTGNFTVPSGRGAYVRTTSSSVPGSAGGVTLPIYGGGGASLGPYIIVGPGTILAGNVQYTTFLN